MKTQTPKTIAPIPCSRRTMRVGLIAASSGARKRASVAQSIAANATKKPPTPDPIFWAGVAFADSVLLTRHPVGEVLQSLNRHCPSRFVSFQSGDVLEQIRIKKPEVDIGWLIVFRIASGDVAKKSSQRGICRRGPMWPAAHTLINKKCRQKPACC